MKTNVTIKMDETERDRAKALFDTIGLDLTTAVKLFIKAALRENGIPFPLNTETYGTDISKLEKRWSSQLKTGEQQAAAGELTDFHTIATRIKGEYGLD